MSATGPPSAPGLLPVTGTARSDLVSPRQTLRVRLSHSGVFEPRYLGSRDIPNSTCRYGAVVGAVGATNVTVTGGGIIDGQGWHFWDLVDKNHQTPGTLNCSRPHLVEFEALPCEQPEDLRARDTWQYRWGIQIRTVYAPSYLSREGGCAPHADPSTGSVRSIQTRQRTW